jgi:hypothetical protein
MIERLGDVSIMQRSRWRTVLWRLMLLAALTSLAVGGVWGDLMRRLSIDFANKARWCEFLERSCAELKTAHLKSAQDDENLVACVLASGPFRSGAV